MAAELFREIPVARVDVAPSRRPRRQFLDVILQGFRRRWLRERRRRKVGRAYDMALETARVIPRGSEVLDVGCGNGFIAHHLSAMLRTSVIGIDVMEATQAPIDYRRYDGEEFPVADDSVDAVLLCYVLHHAQDVHAVLGQIKRVLLPGGLAVIYEDIPETRWDRFICWTHDRQWKSRTGTCAFRGRTAWRKQFDTSGFKVITDRPLSRWRNLLHPVSRHFFVLRSKRKNVY